MKNSSMKLYKIGTSHQGIGVRLRTARSVSSMASAGEAVKVAWKMEYRVKFGENVRCVGGHDQLGNWNPERGFPLEWSEGDAWVGEAELQLPPEIPSLEYKYIVVGSENNVVSWKPGSNYVLDLQAPPPGAKVIVHDTWTWDCSDRKVKIELEVETVSTSGGNQSDGEGGHSQLSQMAGQSMTELQDVLAMHHDVQSRFSDPAAVEVLQADRLLATVNKKAVAMNNALKASKNAAQLPSPRSPNKDNA